MEHELTVAAPLPWHPPRGPGPLEHKLCTQQQPVDPAEELRWFGWRDKPPSAKTLETARSAMPAYRLRRGVFADCGGDPRGFHGKPSGNLLGVKRGVHDLAEASQWCDATPGCTHFSIMVGPKDGVWPFWERLAGMPGRLDLCSGTTMSTRRVPEPLSRYHFVGFKHDVTSVDGDRQEPVVAVAPLWFSAASEVACHQRRRAHSEFL